MAVNEIQKKLDRKAKLQEELRRLENERIAAEEAAADAATATRLDAELADLESQVARAKELNKRAQAQAKGKDVAPIEPIAAPLPPGTAPSDDDADKKEGK